jgi:hypothetical protein
VSLAFDCFLEMIPCQPRHYRSRGLHKSERVAFRRGIRCPQRSHVNQSPVARKRRRLHITRPKSLMPEPWQSVVGRRQTFVNGLPDDMGLNRLPAWRTLALVTLSWPCYVDFISVAKILQREGPRGRGHSLPDRPRVAPHVAGKVDEVDLSRFIPS